MIQMQVFNSISDGEDLHARWQRILAESRHVTPFHTYEWTKANLLAFPNDGVRILVFTDGPSDVIAIIPFVLRRGRRYLNVRRWIEFAGLPHADYAGHLIRPGHEQAVAQGVLDFLKTTLTSSDAACLDKLRSDDRFAEALISAAREQDWHVVPQSTDKIRHLSAESYLQAKDGAVAGTSLDKARRKLASKGDLRFDVLHQPAEIMANLDTFARLHIERFAFLGAQSPLASLGQKQFYRLFVEECGAAGYVWLSRLLCGESPVAMRLSFFRNQTLHLYSTCFDQQFSKYSPSVLQLQMLLEHAFQNGVQLVDFGVGESPHKQLAGTSVQSPLMNVELYRSPLPWIERKSYGLADRIGGRWPVIRKAGRRLRKLLPYRM